MTEAATTVANAEPALRLRGVGRRFGGLQAVRDVDLDVPHGERHAVLGPNGAGKTTLFNLVAGDLRVSDGSIELFGGDVTQAPARQRAKLGVARSYQQSRLFAGLTVEENIYLAIVGVEGGRLLPVVLPKRNKRIRERAHEAAARVAIHDKLGALVDSLSHGEHRQIAIAMALAARPKLLLLDEPASGLSRGERGLLADLLLGLGGEITLVLIEHDMDIALNVAEQVTMMHDGRVIARGTPAEIRANQMVHDLYLGRGHHDE